MPARSSASTPSSRSRGCGSSGSETTRYDRRACGAAGFTLMTLAGAVDWTFLGLAVTTTVLTGALLIWSLVGRRGADANTRSDRRRPSAAHGDPREALALVGDALAATHNPRVLLPVILEVITEATGALGGQVFVGRGDDAAALPAGRTLHARDAQARRVARVAGCGRARQRAVARRRPAPGDHGRPDRAREQAPFHRGARCGGRTCATVRLGAHDRARRPRQLQAGQRRVRPSRG